MYDLFDTFFNPWYEDNSSKRTQKQANTQNLMQTDIFEYANGYELSMDLPGYSKDEVQAELCDGYLTITATKSAEQKDDGQYLRRERYAGSCKRTFRVGDYLRQEDIKASFQNGVLTLFIPKEDKKKIEESKYITIE